MDGDTLDVWFNHMESKEEIGEEQRWQERASREGPSVWRYKDNPITNRLAETLCQDECIEYRPGDPATKQVHSVAAGLLDAYRGDIDLVIRALERCRKSAVWRELNLYVKRKNIEIMVAKIRLRDRGITWRTIADEQGLFEEKVKIQCPRCQKLIYPEHLDLPCEMH